MPYLSISRKLRRILFSFLFFPFFFFYFPDDQQGHQCHSRIRPQESLPRVRERQESSSCASQTDFIVRSVMDHATV
ncbi:hypothetical protein BDV37DRAFT_255165 [Aspergillus pseudonomiae]|uniref:Uncharacterized protein n=1 Tax=Aspergillus pseudonomiae TaxID=1506151 RepID=A0A5N7D4X4_9EURO|nr:uncharacterized protein BDV37DRAFT_255165 [Aspergillus pseudonomiae]KAE8401455.1 hypothetical protein BDV37DRAFT_255165 [Aspergillus pseudonomiae]